MKKEPKKSPASSVKSVQFGTKLGVPICPFCDFWRIHVPFFFSLFFDAFLDPFFVDFASQKELKMDPTSINNRFRKQPNNYTTKKNKKTTKINKFPNPLSYKSKQTVEAKRLFSHFHLSCNKLAQETEKLPKMEPKWKQNGAKMG